MTARELFFRAVKRKQWLSKRIASTLYPLARQDAGIKERAGFARKLVSIITLFPIEYAARLQR
jgi:hypothetical protein